MPRDEDKRGSIAPDLDNQRPRRLREALGGFGIAAGMLHEARADVRFCTQPGKMKFFFDVYDVEDGLL